MPTPSRTRNIVEEEQEVAVGGIDGGVAVGAEAGAGPAHVGDIRLVSADQALGFPAVAVVGDDDLVDGRAGGDRARQCPAQLLGTIAGADAHRGP